MRQQSSTEAKLMLQEKWYQEDLEQKGKDLKKEPESLQKQETTTDRGEQVCMFKSPIHKKDHGQNIWSQNPRNTFWTLYPPPPPPPPSSLTGGRGGGGV